MASISFTYNGNYDENKTVIFLSNFEDVYTNNAGSYLFSNNDWGYGFFAQAPQKGSTAFIDDERGVQIGSDYAVSLDLSDNTGSVDLTGGSFGDLFRGGTGDDSFNGLDGNDVFEGGAGADTFNGGSGIDRVSYAHAAAGVRADLLLGVNIEGDAAGDRFDSIENLTGSLFADNLRGDEGDNTLRGNGGEDTLSGEGGRDRLVASVGVGDIIGGEGIDSLFVVGGGTFTVDPARLVGIEKVFVRGGTNFDMSESFSGMSISSNSQAKAGVSLIGSRATIASPRVTEATPSRATKATTGSLPGPAGTASTSRLASVVTISMASTPRRTTSPSLSRVSTLPTSSSRRSAAARTPLSRSSASMAPTRSSCMT